MLNKIGFFNKIEKNNILYRKIHYFEWTNQ